MKPSDAIKENACFGHITLAMLREWDACSFAERVAYFAGRPFVTAREVGEDETLDRDERVWVLTRLLQTGKGPGSLGLVACACVDRAVRYRDTATRPGYANYLVNLVARARHNARTINTLCATRGTLENSFSAACACVAAACYNAAEAAWASTPAEGERTAYRDDLRISITHLIDLIEAP